LQSCIRQNYTDRVHDREYARQALGHVSLSPYDPSWPACFQRERERLRPILGAIAEDLEHYGSTAVPGLSAKPILDMMGPVGSLDAADALAGQLAEAGYRKIDAGFFKRRFFRREADDTGVAYHLHLVVAPAWPVKNELLLRDWLIGHPEQARAYEALKVKLAASYRNDMPQYTHGKTAFLQAAVNAARRQRGLPEEENWEE
jgi:GrpB-like predicted nucleotidyltransferase (UPF0157 family)